MTGAVWRDGTRDRSGLVLNVSWELDLWGRVRAAGASAGALRDATAADALSARQSIAALVATTWYQTIATERLRQTAIAAAATSRRTARSLRPATSGPIRWRCSRPASTSASGRRSPASG